MFLEEAAVKAEQYQAKLADLQAELKKDSGVVSINSRLTSFLYQLLRDELPAGTVMKVLAQSLDPDVTYTNGFLADLANWISKQLYPQ